MLGDNWFDITNYFTFKYFTFQPAFKKNKKAFCSQNIFIAHIYIKEVCFSRGVPTDPFEEFYSVILTSLWWGCYDTEKSQRTQNGRLLSGLVPSPYIYIHKLHADSCYTKLGQIQRWYQLKNHCRFPSITTFASIPGTSFVHKQNTE